MRYARSAGYPVPEVYDVRADGSLEIERIEGTTMLERFVRAPWQLAALAETLADLHRRLHVIEAPDDREHVDPGTRLLHLDLHPENVMMTPTGPVVIDWANACAGSPGIDVAMTWVLLATADIPGNRLIRALIQRMRHRFVGRFLESAGRDAARDGLETAAARRLFDINTTETERQAIAALLEAELR